MLVVARPTVYVAEAVDAEGVGKANVARQGLGVVEAEDGGRGGHAIFVNQVSADALHPGRGGVEVAGRPLHKVVEVGGEIRLVAVQVGKGQRGEHAAVQLSVPQPIAQHIGIDGIGARGLRGLDRRIEDTFREPEHLGILLPAFVQPPPNLVFDVAPAPIMPLLLLENEIPDSGVLRMGNQIGFRSVVVKVGEARFEVAGKIEPVADYDELIHQTPPLRKHEGTGHAVSLFFNGQTRRYNIFEPLDHNV